MKVILDFDPAAPPWRAKDVRVLGRLAPRYRPTALDGLAEGAIGFVMSSAAAALKDRLRPDLSGAALIVRESALAELDPGLVAAFTAANALIVTKGSPRAVFAALLRRALPDEHNLLRPAALEGVDPR
ncbi:MAG: hypothetical protein WCF16_08225, partial [Alphaproteobacteria bacterium]